MRLKMVTNTTGTSTNMNSVPAKTVKKIVKKAAAAPVAEPEVSTEAETVPKKKIIKNLI